MSLIVAILLLLVVSRVAAELAERVGQPAMIGEILAGLILGPALLGLIHESPELTAIADIGLLMLVLLAGMEIELKQLFDAFRGRNLWISADGLRRAARAGGRRGRDARARRESNASSSGCASPSPLCP